jgi:serine/threonine protein kinase
LATDVRIGELLGQGEFGDVFDINSFLPDFGPCDCTRCLDQSSQTQRSEHDQEPIRPENDDHSESTEVSQELHERKNSKVDFAAFASILDWRNTTIYVPTAPGNHATGFVNNELKTPSEEDSIPPDALVDKAYMKKHCIRKELSRFAVKRVRSDIQKGKYKFGAALDLAREAMFLAHLSHPNIIKIRGTIGESGTPEFCLILDRMVTTLDKSILEWKRDVKNRRLNWNVAKRWGESRALENKRLVVMYDISRAMKYLHKNG